jgi:hypothetical protein
VYALETVQVWPPHPGSRQTPTTYLPGDTLTVVRDQFERLLKRPDATIDAYLSA